MIEQEDGFLPPSQFIDYLTDAKTTNVAKTKELRHGKGALKNNKTKTSTDTNQTTVARQLSSNFVWEVGTVQVEPGDTVVMLEMSEHTH